MKQQSPPQKVTTYTKQQVWCLEHILIDFVCLKNNHSRTDIFIGSLGRRLGILGIQYPQVRHPCDD